MLASIGNARPLSSTADPDLAFISAAARCLHSHTRRRPDILAIAPAYPSAALLGYPVIVTKPARRFSPAAYQLVRFSNRSQTLQPDPDRRSATPTRQMGRTGPVEPQNPSAVVNFPLEV